MKFLVLSIFVATVVASPTYRLVDPGITGPAPVIIPDHESISIGPAIVNPEPIAIGPAILDNFEPIAIGPAIVDESVVPAPVLIPDATQQPVVQIIINVNQQGQIIGEPAVISPAPVEAEIVPEPVIVVEEAVDPVIVVEQPAEPVIIVETAPILPSPVITLPEELN